MDVQLNNKSTSHKSSPLTVGAPLNVGHPLSVGSPLTVGTPLCEDGRPYVTDPVTGRQMCMCGLGVGAEVHFPHVSLGHESRKQGAMPGPAGPHCLGFDSSAFCSPVIRGLPIRPDRMPQYMTAGIPGHSVTFDPSLAGHPYGLLYPGMDMNGPMRKAATRETTGPLKAWLSEHKKNPYPTKAEKIMLAIITRMTLTQVSTWFANARRRLKKENKLYSGDRENRPDDDFDDDDDDVDSQKDGSGSHRTGSDKLISTSSDNEDINVDDFDETLDDADLVLSKNTIRGFNPGYMFPHGWPSSGSDASPLGESFNGRVKTFDDPGNQHADVGPSRTGSETPEQSSSGSKSKPKIWSISEIIGSSKETSQHRVPPTSRPVPPLVIPNPFLPPHLSSSHMNPSPLLTAFTSSLGSSAFTSSLGSSAAHRFHPQLAGVSSLFYPVMHEHYHAPSATSVSSLEHSNHRPDPSKSPMGKRSPLVSQYAVIPKKEQAEDDDSPHESKRDRFESSENSSVKSEENVMKSEMAGKCFARTDNSDFSHHSLTVHRKKANSEHSTSNVTNLKMERTNHRSDKKNVSNSQSPTSYSAHQSEMSIKSDRHSLGDTVLNLQKTKTIEK